MTTPNSPLKSRKAVRYLRAADPVLRTVIDAVGPFSLQLEPSQFRMLVRSIISQQISTKAARAIHKRVQGLVKPRLITAENLSRFSTDELRSAGLSPQKIRYIIDLTEKVTSGELKLRRLGRLPDEEIIEQLIVVKGIGRWTAQMFLMFCLGRLDVFPHDDLGIRSAIKRLYELDELPDKTSAIRIATPWRPYASVASWYCWRSLDL
jgi:DNA-3-methyladenine glycosylase II